MGCSRECGAVRAMRSGNERSRSRSARVREGVRMARLLKGCYAVLEPGRDDSGWHAHEDVGMGTARPRVWAA